MERRGFNSTVLLFVVLLILGLGGAIFYILVSKSNTNFSEANLLQSPSPAKAVQDNNKARLVVPTADSAGDKECGQARIWEKDGNLYYEVSGSAAIQINEGNYQANPNDFYKGWVFIGSTFIFDCNHLLTTQRINFTTGGGFEEYAFAYDVKNGRFFKIGNSFFTSQNKNYALVLEVFDNGSQMKLSRLGPDLSLKQIFPFEQDGTVFRYYASGPFFSGPIINNEGVIYSLAWTKDQNPAEIKLFDLIKISSDGKPKVVKIFDEDKDERINFTYYDNETSTLFLGLCFLTKDVDQSPDQLVLDCSYSWTYRQADSN